MSDFRGPEGFWRNHPPYAKFGLSFEQLANPEWFTRDPALARGFYGHRLELYRRTTPHAGFTWLRSLARGRFIVIELGAGTHISTVRAESEKLDSRIL